MDASVLRKQSPLPGLACQVQGQGALVASNLCKNTTNQGPAIEDVHGNWQVLPSISAWNELLPLKVSRNLEESNLRASQLEAPNKLPPSLDVEGHLLLQGWMMQGS
jgi:hypothetical protein